MAIIQISKIQVRSGDLVDLPQLDEGEFGFASDEKRLFIGKTTGQTENVEVLTSYSELTMIRSVGTGISAAGSTQSTATLLDKDINVVSTVSAGQGVRLPLAVAGMVMIINNTSGVSLNVYPAIGANINSLSANAAYPHSAGQSIQYYSTTDTQWYTM